MNYFSIIYCNKKPNQKMTHLEIYIKFVILRQPKTNRYTFINLQIH